MILLATRLLGFTTFSWSGGDTEHNLFMWETIGVGTLHNIEKKVDFSIYLVGGLEGEWVGRWVGGLLLQEIIQLHGSILQAGTCQIFSLAENLRWSRVWQYSYRSTPNFTLHFNSFNQTYFQNIRARPFK